MHSDNSEFHSFLLHNGYRPDKKIRHSEIEMDSDLYVKMCSLKVFDARVVSRWVLKNFRTK